jgi:hypothetical protein
MGPRTLTDNVTYRSALKRILDQRRFGRLNTPENTGV